MNMDKDNFFWKDDDHQVLLSGGNFYPGISADKFSLELNFSTFSSKFGDRHIDPDDLLRYLK